MPAAINASRLLDRFLRYVQVDTTADESAQSYPSSPGQFELGRMLADELRRMGATDVEQDANGLVWATVPATCRHDAPTFALNSHLDTSPETTGKGVKPQVIRNYSGGDIRLPGDPSKVITVAASPELSGLVGSTLITTDGTTLLGADDKAGLAVIMETAQHLLEHPEIEHGPVRILFTCDEEIGRGVRHVDLAKLNAVACYNLDGQGANEIDVETFSANLAVVKVRGVNIHPAIAKGRMINSIRAASAFIDLLPRDTLAPEITDGRDGFVHPYVMQGSVAETTIRILMRDFDTHALEDQARLLRNAAEQVQRQCKGVTVEVEISKQYRNMADTLRRDSRAVDFAVEAHRRLGREPKMTIVRGGTDGSQLSEQGLPTPNLSTGQHNLHSPLEWACLEEMGQAADVLVEVARIWAEKGRHGESEKGT